MAQLIFSETALADLKRLGEFLLETDPKAAVETGRLITEAVRVLCNHPLIGRIVKNTLRELVIARGRSGYIALYRFDAIYDEVHLLTIRHQREVGYSPTMRR